MKKSLLALALLAGLTSVAGAQHVFPAQDTINTFSNNNTFQKGIILGGVTFANLPLSPTNGQEIYCTDCIIQTSCASGGTGAFAERVAGSWNCGNNAGGGGSGADQHLSNLLAQIQISTPLTPNTAALVGMGTTALPFSNYIFGGAANQTATLSGSFTGNRTWTFQDASDTVVGRATPDTLTNKTFNTGGAGNVFQIAGTGITAVTGTGAVALANAPTFIGSVTIPTLINGGSITTASNNTSIAVTFPGASGGGSTANFSVTAGGTSGTLGGGNVNLTGGASTTGIAGAINLNGGAASSTGQGGNVVATPGTSSTGTAGLLAVMGAMAFPFTNSGTSGPAANKLVSLDASGNAVITPPGALTGLQGVCGQGCTNSGTSLVVTSGLWPVVFDSTATPGHFACISNSVIGEATDCATATTQTVGTVKSFVSGTTYLVEVDLLNGGGSGSGLFGLVSNPGTTQLAIPTISTATGLAAQCPAGAVGTLACFFVNSNTGGNILSVQQNGTVQFGAGVGGSILASFFGASTSPLATAGVLRGANTDCLLGWRNNANTGNVTLCKNTSDVVSLSGGTLISTGGVGGGLVTLTCCTPTVDLNAGTGFIMASMTGNVTLNFINIPTSPLKTDFQITLCQDGTGGRTATATGVQGFMTVGRAPSQCTTQALTSDGSLIRGEADGKQIVTATSTLFVIDGTKYSSVCDVVQNVVPANTVATIMDYLLETNVACDPFSFGKVIHLFLGGQTAPYTWNVPMRLSPNSWLAGFGRGLSGLNTRGTTIKPGSGFASPFVANPPSGFTIAATSSGCGAHTLPAGTYLAEVTWGPDTTRETTAAQETSVTLNGSNCIGFTPPVSPPAPVTTYDMYSCQVNACVSGQELWQNQAAIGVSATIAGNSTNQFPSSGGSGKPPNLNNTGSFIIVGNANGAQGNVISSQATFGARLQDLSIDCAGTTGLVAAANLTGEEGSGIFRVDGTNCGGVAMFIWEGYGNLGTAASNSRMEDLTANAGQSSCVGTCDPTVAEIYIDGMNNNRGLNGLTATPTAATTSVCILNNGFAGNPQGGPTIEHVHLEKCADGIKEVNGSGFIFDVTCAPSNMTNCLHFDATSNGMAAMAIRGGNNPTFAIKDESNGFTSTQGFIPFYSNSMTLTPPALVAGAAPTCTALPVNPGPNLTGVSGTCAMDTGSNNYTGTMNFTAAGGSELAAGTVELIFAGGGYGVNSASCTFIPVSAGTAWPDNTTFRGTQFGTGNVQVRFIPGGGTGTAFANGNTFKINYTCLPY